MARDGALYICQACGAASAKWSGQCAACNAWNTLVEEPTSRPPGALAPARGGKSRGLQFQGLASETAPARRLVTGLQEFDRVCGGGIGAWLGHPARGGPRRRQIHAPAAGLRGGGAGGRCLRLRLGRRSGRADPGARRRLGLADAPVRLAAETALRDIVEALKREPLDLVVIDSVQTLWSDMHEAGPGSVTQVRACAGELVRLAKRRGTAVLLVGHVTKDGQVAGPRVVEHMVDAVLSFEGERGYPFRILRGAKNRFGRH